MRVDVHIAREALKVALPTNREIGPWQQRAAWLLAIAERRHGRGRGDRAVADEAREILTAVEQQRSELVQSVGTLPRDVAGSSRLEDTAKALDSVALVLRRAIELADPKVNS